MSDAEDFERGWHEGYREAQTWVLVLDAYQRDNLLGLLNTLGYPRGPAVEPFGVLNTGEWVGEIACMLAAPGTEAAFQMFAEKTGTPEITQDEVLDYLQKWLVAAP